MARCNVSGQDSHVAMLNPERRPFGRAIASQAAAFPDTVASASQHTQPSPVLGLFYFLVWAGAELSHAETCTGILLMMDFLSVEI